MTTRRTYSCLAIARRHPTWFRRMTQPGHGPSGAGPVEIPGSAVHAYHWPQVLPRAVPAREQRIGPRSSRFADLGA